MDIYEELYYAERNRRYSLERYHGEDLAVLPFALVMISMLLSFLQKCFLYLSALCLLACAVFFVVKRLQRKKRMRFAEKIILTTEEAQKGICLRVHVDDVKEPLTLDVMVPAGVSDGQTLRLRGVHIKGFCGKKDIYFTVKIKKEDC